MNFISNYTPDYNNDIELPSHLEQKDQDLDKAENPNCLMDEYIKDLKEIRQEQKELYQEYMDLRILTEKNVDLEDEKEIVALKDDV